MLTRSVSEAAASNTATRLSALTVQALAAGNPNIQVRVLTAQTNVSTVAAFPLQAGASSNVA